MTASKQSQGGNPDDGQKSCPKLVEFYNRVNLDNSASGWLFKKKPITMRGNMNVKCVISVFGTIGSSKIPTDLLFPFYFKITLRRILR